jgi:hypothetical protein
MHGSDTEVTEKRPVIPAQAGIHPSEARPADKWIPAYAGMTKRGTKHQKKLHMTVRR